MDYMSCVMVATAVFGYCPIHTCIPSTVLLTTDLLIRHLYVVGIGRCSTGVGCRSCVLVFVGHIADVVHAY